MTTALLVMDAQQGILGRLADDDAFLTRWSDTIDAARAAGLTVVHVVVQFRPGHPEVSATNMMFAKIASLGALVERTESAANVPALAPHDGELVVTKRRVSAFSGSDLDAVLRSVGIDHLVLTGVATSGVVLSTLRQAADLDFAVTVISDCCADPDAEAHRVLVERIFPRQATVIDSEEWSASLADGAEATPS